ncbi:MAG: hypothetical protein Fur0032_00920 [Terrimicrobiaceae bacterium]
MASGYRSSSAASSARRRQHDRHAVAWQLLSKVVSALIFVTLLVGAGLWFYPELQKKSRMVATLEAKKLELEKEQLLRKQREREKSLLENDPEYIETIARDRLDLMREGETIFRLESGSNATVEIVETVPASATALPAVPAHPSRSPR